MAISSRLSYANVMSTLAVVLVLTTGTAYAANTVFSTDIVDGEVKAADIGTGQVKSADIAGGAVRFEEIALGTLPQFMASLTSSSAMSTATTKEVTTGCEGNAVTGGGFTVAGPGGVAVPGVIVTRSSSELGTGWKVRAVATSGTPTWQLTVVAVCIQ